MPLAVDDELGKNRAVGGCRGSSSDPPLSRALGEEKGVGTVSGRSQSRH